jgi:Asp-tRNA(Asn)/Glu-tRNA(Gln) amidotransferase A subunit family amidase
MSNASVKSAVGLFGPIALILASGSMSSVPTAAGLQADAFSIDETTVARIQTAFASESIACRSLVRQYLDRSATLAGRVRPSVAISGAADLLKTADDLDRRFRETGALGPLHCIPVAAANAAPEAVDRLRQAGAVMVSVGNERTDSTDAVSAAVDANLAVAGVRPSRPAAGEALPADGVVELRGAEHAFVARKVADAYAILRAVVDRRGAAGLSRSLPASQALDDSALRGARLGVVHEMYEIQGADRRVLDIFAGAIGELGNLGAAILERVGLAAGDLSARTSANNPEAVRAALIKLMDELELDAVIYPASAARPAGLPTATVPMGSTRDRLLRPGLQFVGRPPDDQLIMNLAYSYERATNHRRPPP